MNFSYLRIRLPAIAHCGYSLLIVRCWLLLFLLVPNKLFAQLWRGNLGAPVMKITFGAGNSQALPNGTTTYGFTSGCPEPGQYSLENFLVYGCYKNTIPLTGDHTKDFGGKYMLVNGEGAVSSDVLVVKIGGLCSNTTYQFAAFLANCLKLNACGGTPVLPNLTFFIEAVDGTILVSHNSGDLPVTGVMDWVEYGVWYTTPAVPAPLILRIKSNAANGCGSSFIMDDVTLRPAGPRINITLDGRLNYDVTLCNGYPDPLLLKATFSTGYNDPVIQWQQSIDTGKSWQDITGAIADNYTIPRRKDSVVTYRIRLSERINDGNSGCTIFSQIVRITVHPTPGHLPLQLVQGCLNKSLKLNPPPDFYAYQWAGSNGYQSSDPSPIIKNIQYANEGLYTVLATGDFGCRVLDSFQLYISPSTTIYTNTLYSVCEGTAVNLSATGDGTYVWTPSAYLSNPSIANPVANPKDSFQYKVVLTNSYGCKDSAQVNINVFKKTLVSAGGDKIILAGDTVLLDGSVKGTAVNYLWTSTGNVTVSQVLQPSVAPTIETSFTLYATSTLGCGNASAVVTIHVYKDVFMASAFSPNGDGLNEIYHVFKLDSYQLVSFAIFNRFGKRVFSTVNANDGWDGTFQGEPQAIGHYVYYLELKHVGGRKITRKGSILLIR